MSGLLRLASHWICGLMLAVLPAQEKMWAHAVRAEVDHIEKDLAALFFALDSLRGVLLLLLFNAVSARLTVLGRSFFITNSRIAQVMNKTFDAKYVGVVCAIMAVCFGLMFLFAAGAAVVGGTILLLVPAFFGLRSGALDRTQCTVFAVIWLSIIFAAALGNYPTPVVGYGASAILGYILSLRGLLRSANLEAADCPSVPSRTISRHRDGQSPLAGYQPI